MDWEVNDIASSVSEPSDHWNSTAIGQQRYPNQNMASSILEIEATNEGSSVASTETKQVNCFSFLRLLLHMLCGTIIILIACFVHIAM